MNRPLGSRVIRYVRDGQTDGHTDGRTDESKPYFPLPTGEVVIMTVHCTDMEVGVAGACLRVRSAAEQRGSVLSRLDYPTSRSDGAPRSCDNETSTLERHNTRLLFTQVARMLNE